MIIHSLKCWPIPFSAIYHGEKNWELRKDDRQYSIGNYLLIKEWDNEKQEYTGSFVEKQIVWILRSCPEWGLMDGFCILSLGATIKQGYDPDILRWNEIHKQSL